VNHDLKQPLSGGLKTALDESVLPGEEIELALEGMPGQAIVLTSTRVIIIKAGSASGAMFGRKTKGYGLEHVTSVEYSCGLTEGRIQLTVAGAVEQRQGWMSKRGFLDELAASRQAETVCQFPARRKQLFQEAAKTIQAAVMDARRGPATPTSLNAAPSDRTPPAMRDAAPVEERLRRLAKLRDDGLISPDDFERKKQEVLADL